METLEKRLGFTLPSILRNIYLEVGNGGFGPGYGLLPLNNKSSGKQFAESVISLYTDYLTGDPENPEWKWPKGMLPLCDWGDNIHSCVDCLKEPFPVYRSDAELLSDGDVEGLKIEKSSLYGWLMDMIEDRIKY